MTTLQELAGSALVSFEGDLKGTALLEVHGASGNDTAALRRNTLWPRQDFVVLPLEVETVASIVKAIGGTVPRGILHIQVEKAERLELGVYDNFAPHVMFFGSSMTPELVEKLREEGVLMPWTKK